MTVREKDIKTLWGLSAGRCNYPGCGEVCIHFIDRSNPMVIGEMAHIIARSPEGPRAQPAGDEHNTYENLILLCPTHHTLVDKGPAEKFPAELLHDWKRQHEAGVAQALVAPSFADKKELCEYAARILAENKRLWSTFGPESELARNNPMNTAAMIWALRKLDTIVPNNRILITVLRRHASLFEPVENDICNEFMTHADAFEMTAYERQDSNAVPRFPVSFEKMMLENAQDG